MQPDLALARPVICTFGGWADSGCLGYSQTQGYQDAAADVSCVVHACCCRALMKLGADTLPGLSLGVLERPKQHAEGQQTTWSMLKTGSAFSMLAVHLKGWPPILVRQAPAQLSHCKAPWLLSVSKHPRLLAAHQTPFWHTDTDCTRRDPTLFQKAKVEIQNGSQEM